MHSLLEDYLVEMAAQLHSLPPARRIDELREMYQHLVNAVTVNKELGRSENEAVQAALDQFGSPQEVGDTVVWAWRRGRALEKRSFWGATASASVLTLVMPYLLSPLVNPFFRHAIQRHTNLDWVLLAAVLFRIGIPLLVGGICGLAFFKRAVGGTGAATLVYLFEVVQFLHVVYGRHLSVDALDLYGNIIVTFIQALVMVLAARAGSRWRTRRAATV